MGGDGGSIPTRADLVKLKDKEKKADPHEQQKIRWSYCTMSNQPLAEPVVADELGNLYNKEHVLKYLVDRKNNPEKHYDAAFQHIHSSKVRVHCHSGGSICPSPFSERSPIDTLLHDTFSLHTNAYIGFCT